MEKTSAGQTHLVPAEPRFKIGQNVHLKRGGPEMVVNQCTQGLDGKFVVDTNWFDVNNRRIEARATYREELLDGHDIPLNKKSPTGVNQPDSSVSSRAWRTIWSTPTTNHVRSRQIRRELQIALLSDPFMRLIDALDPVDRIADVALGYRHEFADFILPGRRRSQHPR